MLVIGSTKPAKSGSSKTEYARPQLIGVCGGSGSGKTTFARALQKKLGREQCEILFQDNFYIDQSQSFDYDGGSVNFDHPDSIDFKLLTEKLALLKQNQAVQIPIYDFASHRRLNETLSITPKRYVIVDGILIFHWEPLREILDELIFFDTDEKLRFQRRLIRDVQERGRQPDGVHAQFYKQVKPMHDEYVEPTKLYANHLVKDPSDFDAALENIWKKLSRS